MAVAEAVPAPALAPQEVMDTSPEARTFPEMAALEVDDFFDTPRSVGHLSLVASEGTDMPRPQRDLKTAAIYAGGAVLRDAPISSAELKDLSARVGI